MRILVHLIIIVAVLFFLFFLSSRTLTSFPQIHSDETAFSSIAYGLLHPHSLAVEDFDTNIPLMDKTPLTHYGPPYSFGLSVPLYLFGYSVYTVRYFSIFLAALSLILLYFLLHRASKSIFMSGMAVFFLASDFFFLKSAKFGRMEMMALCFQLAAYLSYFYLLKKMSIRYYIFTSVLATAALFTHFIVGLPAFLTIIVYTLIFKRSVLKRNGLLYFASIPFICVILWIIYIAYFADKSAVNASYMMISKRYIPDFFPLKYSWDDITFYSGINFIFYGLGFFLLLIKFKKNTYEVFWLTAAACTAVIAIWGNLIWYLSLFSISFIPLFFLHSGKKTRLHDYNFLLRISIAIVFFIYSLLQQAKVFSYYQDYSYEKNSHDISECIPKNKNVIVRDVRSDPYFYFVANRKDLRLAYQRYPDIGDVIFKRSMKKADYIVVTISWKNFMETPQFEEAVKKPETRKSYGIDDIAYYIYKNKKSVCVVSGSTHIDPTAVFRLK